MVPPQYLFQLVQRGQRIEDDVPQQCQRPGGGPDRGGQDGPDGENRHGEGEQVAGFAPVERWRCRVPLSPWIHQPAASPASAPANPTTVSACPTYSTSIRETETTAVRSRRCHSVGSSPLDASETAEDRRVRAHQPRVDHPAEPAVVGIAGELCQQQEQRHRGELGGEVEHGRAPGPELPLGEAQQEQDHQRGRGVGQQVGGEEHRAEQRPPVPGLQLGGTDGRHVQQRFRRPGEEASGGRAGDQEDREDGRVKGMARRWPSDCRRPSRPRPWREAAPVPRCRAVAARLTAGCPSGTPGSRARRAAPWTRSPRSARHRGPGGLPR